MPQRLATPPLGKLARWRNDPHTYIRCLDARTEYQLDAHGTARRIRREKATPA